MGFLRRLLQSAPAWPPPGAITWWPPSGQAIQASLMVSIFEPDRPAYVDVVGESHYQTSLMGMAGGKTAEGAVRPDHTAILIPEPDNPYDRNAVRVYLVPEQHPESTSLIGYLSRAEAVRYRGPIYRLALDGKLLGCPAHITGGWDRGGGDSGSFSVVLALDTPGAIMANISGTRIERPNQTTQPKLDERLYATSVCPHCNAALQPLPRAKKKCPSCRQPIFVRLGPDGYTYLLQEIDLAVLQEAWGEYHQAQAAAAAVEGNRQAAQLTAAALDAYRSLGVRFVQLVAEEDCDACSRLAGRSFPIAQAKPLPLPGCDREKEGSVCPCDWSPLVEWTRP